MPLSPERILNHTHMISTTMTTMMIGRLRKPRVQLSSDFPVPPKYGASSKVYDILTKCGTSLKTCLDTAGSYIGRQDILSQFHGGRPKEDEPLKAYFTKLSNYHIQLDHTDDAHRSRFPHTNIHITVISVCDDINGPKA
jgi:hypothetical protein